MSLPLNPSPEPTYQYHTIDVETPLNEDTLRVWAATGWELTGVSGPVSGESRRRTYHFRRRTNRDPVPFTITRVIGD